MKININNLEALGKYLAGKGLIDEEDTIVSASIPGEGNMNYTLRVNTSTASLIVKQANPYVQKYPQLAAPATRAIVEAKFYQTVQNEPALHKMMPGLLHVDEENFIIVLEDLGAAKDMSYLYKEDNLLSAAELASLASYLNVLHKSFKKQSEDELMANRALRSLNHEHIFLYPLMEDNGFDLDTVQPGLQALSMKYKKTMALKEKAATLGKQYLADGEVLLHGDFYPGSWLNVAGEIKVIDPEFSFYGQPEFDVAVMKAHMLMAEHPAVFVETIFEAYQRPANFNAELFDAFTGIEIIRRLIGLAQLPLALSLTKKEKLLNEAVSLLGVAIK